VRKIRVLQVVTRLVRRGVPRHVLDISTHLDPKRFEVEILAGKGEPWEGSLWEEAEEKGLLTHRVPSLQRAINPFKDAVAFGAIYRQIRAGSYDVVHTHISKAGFLGRLAARRGRVPAVVHTYHGRIEELDPGSLKGMILAACERRAARASDALVGVSEEEVRQKRSVGVGEDGQFHVIHAGIDLDRFSETRQWERPVGVTGLPVTGPPVAGSSASGLSASGGPVIGTIGTLTREKGLDLLIETLPSVIERHPQLQLCIVGAGPVEAGLRAQASRLGVSGFVHFPGCVEDVRPWLAVFDLLVQPSRSEGLSLAVLEAMAMGLPVVATDVGGMSEAVKDGVTGRLVPAENSVALATALKAVLGDRTRMEELGLAGRERARKFSVSRSAELLGELYMALLGEVASRPAGIVAAVRAGNGSPATREDLIT
jgi:glycosyltransferase involved in cell wall biosynthesis